MADRMTARRFQRIWDAAEAGNIGAERLLGQMIEKNALMGMAQPFEGGAKPKPSSASNKVGKKEAADQAAHESSKGTGWGSDLDLPGFKLN
jgi:hypothetical protein